MLVLAISKKGAEFFYRAETAHKVIKASAAAIRDALNSSGYMLKPGQVWHIHEVYNDTNAYAYATGQAFTVYKGAIRRKYYR